MQMKWYLNIKINIEHLYKNGQYFVLSLSYIFVMAFN